MSVRVERAGPVTTVVLSRPASRNAVDRATARQLADAYREFDADDGARVAVLWGEGGTFCSGADLKAIGTERGNRVAPDGDGPMGPTRMRLGKPVIAAVAGHAVARAEAELLAAEIARFPQACLRSDRASLLDQEGRDEESAMAAELRYGQAVLPEATAGAARFTAGAGRHGAPDGSQEPGTMTPAAPARPGTAPDSSASGPGQGG